MTFKADEFKDDEGFQEYVKAVTTAAVEEETLELKAKIDTLIGEKRSVTEKLKMFEGIDIEKAKEALEIVEKNEYVKKIADGKFEEVFAERTDQLRTQYEEEMSKINEKLQSAEQRAEQLAKELDNNRIDAVLRKAAIKAGILPEALDDVLARGRQIFSVSPTGDIEARDENGNIRRIEDKILTTARWIETLPKHYWPASESVNITGSSSGASVDERLAAALKSGDLSLYRKLRQKK